MIMGTRSSGIESNSQVIDFNVGLGLRMQMQPHYHHHQQQTLTKTNVHVLDFESHRKMSHSHHHQHHINALPSSSSSNSGEDLGGSIYSTTSNHKTCLVSRCNNSSMGTSHNCSSAGHIIHNNPTDAVYTVPTLQPTNSLTLPCLNSGRIMATSGDLRAGFTASQWQELRTQTMIFKYMMASAPVPPELLLPITKNPPIPQLHRSNRNLDPEPWRCRRTDGKKWRCSRDVAPQQKYCERHSHKNRPRSRKPVELQAQHHVNNNNTNPQPQIQSLDNLNNKPYRRFHFDVQNQTNDPGAGPLFPSPQLPSATPLDHEQPRYLEWFMNGENIAVGNSNNADWNQYMHTNTKLGFKGDIDSSHSSSTTATANTCNRDVHLKQPHVPLYNPYQSTTPSAQGLLAPKLTSFLDPSGQGHETRHFIDAWSDTAPSDDGTDANGNANVGSSLSLTMFGDSEGNEVTGAIGTHLKPHWMNGHVDWLSSPPGGPLAEVLCLGTGGCGSARPCVYEASPHGCSSVTTTSSRSSSKEDGQELNFIN